MTGTGQSRVFLGSPLYTQSRHLQHPQQRISFSLNMRDRSRHPSPALETQNTNKRAKYTRSTGTSAGPSKASDVGTDISNHPAPLSNCLIRGQKDCERPDSKTSRTLVENPEKCAAAPRHVYVRLPRAVSSSPVGDIRRGTSPQAVTPTGVSHRTPCPRTGSAQHRACWPMAEQMDEKLAALSGTADGLAQFRSATPRTSVAQHWALP